MVERGCSGQAAGGVPGVCELAGVQREESGKQHQVPGLCSCLFGTFVGPTCSVDGHNPLLGAGNMEGVAAPPLPAEGKEASLLKGYQVRISLAPCSPQHSAREALTTGLVWLSFSKGGLWRTTIKIFIFFPIRGLFPSSGRK